MKRACRWIGTACIGVAMVCGVSGASAWAAPRPQAAPAATYTLPEYNAFQAADKETMPANRIKLLDDFVAKYPMSTLMKFVYRDYYITYKALKDYAKSMDYVDKELALGDKIDAGTRFEALVTRAQDYYSASADKAMQAPDQLMKARDSAVDGLKALDVWTKPDAMKDDQYATLKKTIGLVFNAVGGMTSSSMKDFKGAQSFYKAALVIDPMDAATHYKLAVAYLQDKPANVPDGTWELGRAIALHVPGDTQVRAYLRSQVVNYQQASCDKLVDDEVNELVTLAGTSADRPATFTIPSADDLQKARDDTADFMSWLQEGGDHGKVMWLATCGSEYPDVGVKVIDVMPGDGDNVSLDVYRPLAADPDAATKEMEGATAANMQLHVVGQPDAKKLMKDDEVRFTGTLSAMTQSPFMLTWDNAKINPDDLKDVAPDKPTPGAKRPAAKQAAPKKPA